MGFCQSGSDGDARCQDLDNVTSVPNPLRGGPSWRGLPFARTLYQRATACGFESGKGPSPVTVNPITAPPPGLAAADTVPPCSAATSRTMDSPRPEPDMLRAVAER